MSNMSYCRFRNTLTDLEDCHDAMIELPDQQEAKKRRKLQERRMMELEEISEDIGLSTAQDEEYGLIENAMDEEDEDILGDEEYDAMRKLYRLCCEIVDEHDEYAENEHG